ncbi:hypothetical protein C2G38_2189187 [Gigaspora rosea]|uniref:Uncharacterized protein n=1 Tax=Gigaspora rosea TaxID=44941 RepID=A0A397V724_9GLOM|nr:hypothetical protein C2G38_2189187 [Gigaspora rosea]
MSQSNDSSTLLSLIHELQVETSSASIWYIEEVGFITNIMNDFSEQEKHFQPSILE